MLLQQQYKKRISRFLLFFFEGEGGGVKSKKQYLQEHFKVILSTFNNHHAIKHICSLQQRKAVLILYKSKLLVKLEDEKEICER